MVKIQPNFDINNKEHGLSVSSVPLGIAKGDGLHKEGHQYLHDSWPHILSRNCQLFISLNLVLPRW